MKPGVHVRARDTMLLVCSIGLANTCWCFGFPMSPLSLRPPSLIARVSSPPRIGRPMCPNMSVSPPLLYFDTIQELQEWESTADIQRARPLSRNFRFAGLPQRRRVMHCHDYGGGYTQSADEDYLATFSSWGLFDLFVYFSHHRVVLPPNIWIEEAHQQNKTILGTFLFEGKSDSIHAQDFLTSKARAQQCADQLVNLCVCYGFDGWLLNIETDLGACRGAFVSFMKYLRMQIKHKVGAHAQVIYYDAHNKDGNFAHQNALLPDNKDYFDSCDGIFVNYQWFDLDTLARSKAEAGTRQFDVYAGVDVWARNCEYEEGRGCKRAVDSATLAAVSLAIFAPGWVQEKGPGKRHRPGSQAARSLDSAFWHDILSET